MTDDEVIARQTALIGLLDRTLRGFRAAGVTAHNGIAVEARVRASDPDEISGWFRIPIGQAVHWRASTIGVQLYTLTVEGRRELCVEAPTAAGAVALASEISHLRRWLGLPEPVQSPGVVETGGELYEVAPHG